MIGILAMAAGAAATAGVMASGTPVSTADKAAVEKIVRDYILAHPEILPQAMDNLRMQETSKAIRANRTAIETPYAGAWEGAANGDVTLVEFFDYACGYCRASLPVVEQLLREDPKLRVVYREFPVLGPDSEAAARVGLAAAKSEKYPAFHRAIYAAGRLDLRAVARVAQQFGVAGSSLPNVEAEREIASNLDLQRKLNITGTPSWVVGDKLLSGAVGYDALKGAIADARAARN